MFPVSNFIESGLAAPLPRIVRDPYSRRRVHGLRNFFDVAPRHLQLAMLQLRRDLGRFSVLLEMGGTCSSESLISHVGNAGLFRERLQIPLEIIAQAERRPLLAWKQEIRFRRGVDVIGSLLTTSPNPNIQLFLQTGTDAYVRAAGLVKQYKLHVRLRSPPRREIASASPCRIRIRNPGERERTSEFWNLIQNEAL